LPPKDISAAFDELKINIPVKVYGIIKWFKNYYVHGRVRRILKNENIIRSTSLFSPLL